jgi:hypothetical protein
MANMSDDELLKEAEKLLLNAPITTIEPVESIDGFGDEEIDDGEEDGKE